MAPSRNYPLGLRVAVTLILIFSISRSVQRVSSSYSETLQRRKMLLGSRPPGCVDKCMNCRPCKATLVIPSHDQRKGYRESSHREDDSYYLLSWKCICGDKLFHP
ncbi:unnamed protein product [Ilex paraguariensis]|uniref:Epidermal patterning factor-like protein n=1 Tax=Ilex paraguariensis TaxID=185542 RepID=A0ABC8T643_9AQUA